MMVIGLDMQQPMDWYSWYQFYALLLILFPPLFLALLALTTMISSILTGQPASYGRCQQYACWTLAWFLTGRWDLARYRQQAHRAFLRTPDPERRRTGEDRPALDALAARSEALTAALYEQTAGAMVLPRDAREPLLLLADLLHAAQPPGLRFFVRQVASPADLRAATIEAPRAFMSRTWLGLDPDAYFLPDVEGEAVTAEAHLTAAQKSVLAALQSAFEGWWEEAQVTDHRRNCAVIELCGPAMAGKSEVVNRFRQGLPQAGMLRVVQVFLRQRTLEEVLPETLAPDIGLVLCIHDWELAGPRELAKLAALAAKRRSTFLLLGRRLADEAGDHTAAAAAPLEGLGTPQRLLLAWEPVTVEGAALYLPPILARCFIRQEHEPQWGTDRLDALRALFGQSPEQAARAAAGVILHRLSSDEVAARALLALAVLNESWTTFDDAADGVAYLLNGGRPPARESGGAWRSGLPLFDLPWGLGLLTQGIARLLLPAESLPVLVSGLRRLEGELSLKPGAVLNPVLIDVVLEQGLSPAERARLHRRAAVLQRRRCEAGCNATSDPAAQQWCQYLHNQRRQRHLQEGGLPRLALYAYLRLRDQCLQLSAYRPWQAAAEQLSSIVTASPDQWEPGVAMLLQVDRADILYQAADRWSAALALVNAPAAEKPGGPVLRQLSQWRARFLQVDLHYEIGDLDKPALRGLMEELDGFTAQLTALMASGKPPLLGGGGGADLNRARTELRALVNAHDWTSRRQVRTEELHELRAACTTPLAHHAIGLRQTEQQFAQLPPQVLTARTRTLDGFILYEEAACAEEAVIEALQRVDATFAAAESAVATLPAERVLVLLARVRARWHCTHTPWLPDAYHTEADPALFPGPLLDAAWGLREHCPPQTVAYLATLRGLHHLADLWPSALHGAPDPQRYAAIQADLAAAQEFVASGDDAWLATCHRITARLAQSLTADPAELPALAQDLEALADHLCAEQEHQDMDCWLPVDAQLNAAVLWLLAAERGPASERSNRQALAKSLLQQAMEQAEEGEYVLGGQIASHLLQGMGAAGEDAVGDLCASLWPWANPASPSYSAWLIFSPPYVAIVSNELAL